MIFHENCLLAGWFGFLHPSQQFFSHIGTGLHGLNQYLEAVLDEVSCSRTQHRDSPSDEVQTSNHLIPSLTFKAPITTAADDKFLRHFSQFSTKIRYDIT